MPVLPLAAVLDDLPDPRHDTRNKLHHLTDILSIATCAVIAGAVSCVGKGAEGAGVVRAHWGTGGGRWGDGTPQSGLGRELFIASVARYSCMYGAVASPRDVRPHWAPILIGPSRDIGLGKPIDAIFS